MEWHLLHPIHTTSCILDTQELSNSTVSCSLSLSLSLSLPLPRQVEDLQFLLEEQGVISGDRLESVEEGTQARLSQLEDQLRREKETSNQLRERLEVRTISCLLLPTAATV